MEYSFKKEVNSLWCGATCNSNALTELGGLKIFWISILIFILLRFHNILLIHETFILNTKTYTITKTKLHFSNTRMLLQKWFHPNVDQAWSIIDQNISLLFDRLLITAQKQNVVTEFSGLNSKIVGSFIVRRTTRFNMKFPVLNSDPLPTEPNLKIWKKLEKTEISTQQIFNALTIFQN